MHQVLARKYRPKLFSEVIGQPHIVQALTNALNQKYLHHAYLFTGTRGVGKTTIARIIAKCLNCETGITASPCGTCQSCQEIDAGRFPDLLEIDAASRTKVEDTRDLLDNVQYAPTKGRFKIYLIDEVHMLSGHSFNALLKTLEEPPEHVKFLLATTDPQKLPATVLSRCLQFHLSTMPATEIAEHLHAILQQESINAEQPALQLLAKAAEGSMRDALSLLDQSIAYSNRDINTAAIQAMLGSIEPTLLNDLIQGLITSDANQLLETSAKLANQGIDYRHACDDLLGLLHQIAVAQFTPEHAHSAAIQQFSAKLSREDVQLYYQIAMTSQRDFAFATQPRELFEMMLLRMLAFTPDSTRQPAPKKQTTVKAQPAKSASTVTADPQANNWEQLLAQLSLSGMAAALAQQLSPKAFKEDVFYFQLDNKHAPLHQTRYVERIESALQKALNKKIKLIIEFGDSDVATPAQLEEQRQTNRQQQAEHAIMNDQHVKKLVAAFDATIIKDSITPTEPTKLN